MTAVGISVSNLLSVSSGGLIEKQTVIPPRRPWVMIQLDSLHE